MSAKEKIRKYRDAEQATIENDVSLEKEEQEKNDVTPEPADELYALQEKLDAARTESKAHYDHLLRVSAEFENYKKRSNRELDEFRKYANETLIRELLTVVDNLERAIDSVNDTAATDACMLEGVRMTHQEILKIFEKFSVKPIVSLDQPFDPVFHQAVLQEETSEKPENTVLKEMQRGYMIHDRLLRPAMVVVSKAAVACRDVDGPDTESDTEKPA